MGFSVAQSYLADILHVISQALLVPVIVLLLAFIAYALYSIGSIISEYFTERRHFNVTMPKFLAALMAAKQDEIPNVIEESGLLNRQKKALLTVYDYRMLPGDALIALIKRLIDEEESRYDRIRSRNNMAARISPMIGLMGTLIPLGPGIEALGRADTAALSSSLLVAFDTTVAGLIVAAVCLAIGKIRGNWYENYLSALDAGMATMLEKIEAMRAAGEITTEEPSDYSFLFGRETVALTEKKPAQSKEIAASVASAASVSSAASASSVAAEPAVDPSRVSAFADYSVPAPASTPAYTPTSTPVYTPASTPAPTPTASLYDEPVISTDSLVDTMPSDMPLTSSMRDSAGAARQTAVPQTQAQPAQKADTATTDAADTSFFFEPPRRPWE